MFYCPVSLTEEMKIVPFLSLDRPRHSTPLINSNLKELAKMEEEFDKMYKNFLGDSLLKSSSPLMQEFFQSKKDSLPKLADGASAMQACKFSGQQTIRTNVGDMKPESISVEVDVTKTDPLSGRPICTLTISGEETSDQGFSKFKSTRTLPLYILENKMEEQIISQLVKDKLTGNRVLEITLPEEPRKAIEDNTGKENFKSEEIKIQIKGAGPAAPASDQETKEPKAATEAASEETVKIEKCESINCS